MGLFNHVKLSWYKGSINTVLIQKYNFNIDKRLNIFNALNLFNDIIQKHMNDKIPAEYCAITIYAEAYRMWYQRQLGV